MNHYVAFAHLGPLTIFLGEKLSIWSKRPKIHRTKVDALRKEIEERPIAGSILFVFIFLADPGKVRGCSTNTFVSNQESDSVTFFLPRLYSVVMPAEWLEIALPGIKFTM